MSKIKSWFEDHIDTISDEELVKMGYDPEEIQFLRECFSEED